ncbi:MAG TPA: prepilin-type N-terminal cleavage/methylation domain-containing protein [Candidatus Angelobacter sp.]|nr:prepilin-type N-terminal cleavage/methylation domain-containing protein [Candidatus Angelobacter sp.]
MKRIHAGFSLIELIVVVAIAIIITAISLPAVRRTISSYQLDESGHNVANMLEQVRSAAVKNNTPYYAQFNTSAGPSIVNSLSAAEVLASANPNPATDPTTNVASQVSFPSATPPNHAQLETAMGLPAGGGSTLQIGGQIGFNSRGLPCQKNVTAWVCDIPAGFEWFMQDGMTGEWEAVTVSPAGRIRAWRMTGNGTWQ